MLIVDFYLDFLDWFYSLSWGVIIFRLKIISIIISAGLFVLVVMVIRKLKALNIPQMIIEVPRVPPEEVSKSWKAVLEKITSSNPSDWNLAVIQADSILDDILKRSGFPGETMGDRLKKLDRSKLSSLDEVWDAHKIRNVIAHDPNRPISRREIERAIDSFEKALKELEFLV